jgi:hypothetical protein
MVDFDVFERRAYFDARKPVSLRDSIESNDVDDFFRGKSLADITLTVLNESYPHDPSACLVFMTSQAFAFFLPAFMKIALEEYEQADVIPEVVIRRFVEMAEGRDKERLDSIVSTYSPSQLRAIGQFLSEMSERYWHKYPQDSAKQALDALWSRYLFPDE